MSSGIDAELAAIVRRELAAALAPLADTVATMVVDKLKAEQARQLVPLSDILGISKRAALGRLANDAELRALGMRVGRQLRFRRHEVEALFAQRQRERIGVPVLKAVRHG